MIFSARGLPKLSLKVGKLSLGGLHRDFKLSISSELVSGTALAAGFAAFFRALPAASAVPLTKSTP